MLRDALGCSGITLPEWAQPSSSWEALQALTEPFPHPGGETWSQQPTEPPRVSSSSQWGELPGFARFGGFQVCSRAQPGPGG